LRRKLGAALGTTFADAQTLTEYLLAKKSYAPTHETVAVTLMSNTACQTRAANLLDALCDVLREPPSANTLLFTRVRPDSTANMHVFQFSPP
jgi:hypothetical protein